MSPAAFASTSSRPAQRPAAQVFGWMAALVKPFRVWRNRRDISSMMGFDERMLADIGLTRGDVAASLSTPLLHDPSAQLTALAHERRNARRAMAREVQGEILAATR